MCFIYKGWRSDLMWFSSYWTTVNLCMYGIISLLLLYFFLYNDCRRKCSNSSVWSMFYDVICKYWPWMKNICIVSNQSAEESTLIPALGQMHGNLVKWTCRVSLSQNNDWFLATLNISCVSVHCNKSSCKYWLKKNKRARFESMTFAWQVGFLT